MTPVPSLQFPARTLYPIGGSKPLAGFRIGWTELPSRLPSFEIPSGWLAVSVCLQGKLTWKTPTGDLVLDPSHAWGFHMNGSPMHMLPNLPGIHRSVLVAWDPKWLCRQPGIAPEKMKRFAQAAFQNKSVPSAKPTPVFRLRTSVMSGLLHLPQPGVPVSAWEIWYQARALEWAALTLFLEDPTLFCHRQTQVDEERIARCNAILRAEMCTPPTLDELAKRLNISPFYLSRLFTRITGETISSRLRRLRVEYAAELLLAGTHNVSEAALDVGYSSFGHFSRAFRQVIGISPSRYVRERITASGKQ